MIAGILLAGQLLAVTLTLATDNDPGAFLTRLISMSLLVLGISLATSAVWCALRRYASRLDNRAAAVLYGLVPVIATGLVVWGVVALLPHSSEGSLLPGDGSVGLLVRSLCISAILGAMLLRYLYVQHMWKLQVEAEADARFQKLQARIRPHFLFNSMNTIANLTHTNPRVAEEVVEDLADLFRAILSDATQASTLAKELELAYRYLNIEKQRLGVRLQVEWDVEDVPGDAILPPLILQPLVENAVYHGIQPSRRPGLIQISGVYQRAQVNLTVRNTLPADNERREQHSRGNRIALDNVKQRMATMFEGQARVIISRVDGDYQVRLVFPYPWKRA